MKVLVLAPESPTPPTSGTRQRVLHLARALAGAFDVELAVLGDVPEATGEPFRLVGVGTHRGRLEALARSVAQPYVAAKLDAAQLGDHAAAAGADSVHAEFPFTVAPARRSGVPVVLGTQNVESDVFRTLARDDGGALRRARWAWEARKTARLEAWAARVAAAVCATSDEDAAWFERHGARRVVVVPNGVDVGRVGYAEPAREPVLAYVGHFGYRPNALAALELVDEVLPAVRASVPGATALIVGREPPADLRRPREGVTVTGEVSDVLPQLRRARATVLPLRSGGGTRLKVLEALAAGVPVVATPLAVAGIDVSDGRDALLAESASDLAAAAARVLADDELARRLSREGRALVERRYDWRAVAKPLVDLHAELGRA